MNLEQLIVIGVSIYLLGFMVIGAIISSKEEKEDKEKEEEYSKMGLRCIKKF